MNVFNDYKDEIVEAINGIAEQQEQTNTKLEELQAQELERQEQQEEFQEVQLQSLEQEKSVEGSEDLSGVLVEESPYIDYSDQLVELNENIVTLIDMQQSTLLASGSILSYAYVFIPLLVIVLFAYWFFKQFLERYI